MLSLMVAHPCTNSKICRHPNSKSFILLARQIAWSNADLAETVKMPSLIQECRTCFLCKVIYSQIPVFSFDDKFE